MVARPAAPYESWSAAEWEARADHAEAFLAKHPDWKVGPDVVRMHRRRAELARQREQAPDPAPVS